MTGKTEDSPFVRRYAAGLVILLTVGSIVGCAGIKSGLPDDYVVQSDLNFGVVIGSVGSITPLPTYKKQERTVYVFRFAADHKLIGSVKSAPFHHLLFSPDPACEEDELPNECGVLFAVKLPVGDYEFFVAHPAMDTQISEAVISNKLWDVPLEDFKFVVKPAQVTYLGNLLSRICTTSNGYFPAARSAIGDVADMYIRDVPLLREKFPQLKTVQIDNETMGGTPWLWKKYKEPQNENKDVEWPYGCSLERGSALELMKNQVRLNGRLGRNQPPR